MCIRDRANVGSVAHGSSVSFSRDGVACAHAVERCRVIRWEAEVEVTVKPTIRSFDLAHLAHLELLTPKPQESLDFFVNVMGMTESGRKCDSVYLRGWDDYEHHTLKLTAAKAAGMGHFAFRTTSPEALDRRVKLLEGAGFGKGWVEDELGHGPAYA